MNPDPMPQTTAQTGDAVTPPFSLHPPKEMPMNRYHGCLKNLWTRVALCAAGLAMSATLLLAVGSAFYSQSTGARRWRVASRHACRTSTQREAVTHAKHGASRRGVPDFHVAGSGR